MSAALPLVRFYFNCDTPLALASELLAGFYAQRPCPIRVRLPDAATLARLDQLLWTAHDFLPHVDETRPHARHTPICLGTAATNPLPEKKPQVLFNLCDEPAPASDYDDYQMIFEIVANSENCRQPARSRWRAYQAAGCTIRPFDAQTRTAL